MLALLDGKYGDEDPAVMDWLRPCFVDIAGEMQLEDAVPLLMDYVGHETDLNMADAADRALQRIGGDVVVREIDARLVAHARTSSSVVRQRAFSAIFAATSLSSVASTSSREKKTTKPSLMLAYALLWNFSEEAIDPLWQFLADMDEDALEPDERDLRYHLVAVCTIMGRTFPFFDEWHEAALAGQLGPIWRGDGAGGRQLQAR